MDVAQISRSRQERIWFGQYFCFLSLTIFTAMAQAEDISTYRLLLIQ